MKKLALVLLFIASLIFFAAIQSFAQNSSGDSPTPKPTKKDPKVLAYEKIGERCLVIWVNDTNQMNNSCYAVDIAREEL